MTQAEKVALRFQYVLSTTGNAQGDFARTSCGAANQMRIFQESMKELGASFGQIILPVFTKVVKAANSIISSFKNLDTDTKTLIIVIAGIAAALPPLIFAFGQLSIAIGVVTGAFTTLGSVMIANPVSLVVTGVVALGTAMVELLHRINPIVSRLQTFFNIIKSGGSPAKFAALQAESMADNLKKQSEEASKAAKALEDHNNQLSIFNNQTAKSTGRSAVGEASVISPSGLTALETNLDPVVPKVDKITQSLNRLKSKGEETAGILTIGFGEIGMGLAETLGAAIASGENAFAALGSSLLSTLGDILTQMGSAAVAASKLASTFAIPIVGAAAGLAAIAIGAGLKVISSNISSKGVPALANGGIVSAPTLAMVGDNLGANRGNPEVISPLNKLQGMMAGSRDVNVGGEFRIQGQDLVVALQRAERHRSRIL